MGISAIFSTFTLGFSLRKLQAEIPNGLHIRETITKTYLIWKDIIHFQQA